MKLGKDIRGIDRERGRGRTGESADSDVVPGNGNGPLIGELILSLGTEGGRSRRVCKSVRGKAKLDELCGFVNEPSSGIAILEKDGPEDDVEGVTTDSAEVDSRGRASALGTSPPMGEGPENDEAPSVEAESKSEDLESTSSSPDLSSSALAAFGVLSFSSLAPGFQRTMSPSSSSPLVDGASSLQTSSLSHNTLNKDGFMFKLG
jgi:hypothetical protein